ISMKYKIRYNPKFGGGSTEMTVDAESQWQGKKIFEAMTAAEVARRIGVRDTTVYSWLQGECRPANPGQIAAFLDSLPTKNGSGIAPTGYAYREYKNWRGIPKPRSCPFCKQAKGVIRRGRGGLSGVCPNCRASGPKRENYDEALQAW